MFKSKILLTTLLVLFSSACLSDYFVTQDQITRTNDSLSKTITYAENLQNQINTTNKNVLEFTSVNEFEQFANDFNNLVDTSNLHISITNLSIGKMQNQLNTLTATKLSTENYNLGIKNINENSQKSYDKLNNRLNDIQTQINSNNIDIANQTSLISKNTYSIKNNTSSIKDNISDINNLKRSVIIKTETVQTTKVLTAGELKNEFSKDLSVADLKYKNLNSVLIKGVANSSISSNAIYDVGYRNLELAGLRYDEDDSEYYVSKIHTSFLAVKSDDVMKMQKGNFITINCQYDYYDQNYVTKSFKLYFKKCLLIQ